jgi:hypothetical protein
MKKYNKPETEILNMDADCHLMEASAPGLGGDYSGGTVLDREEDDLFKSPDLESILQSGK